MCTNSPCLVELGGTGYYGGDRIRGAQAARAGVGWRREHGTIRAAIRVYKHIPGRLRQDPEGFLIEFEFLQTLFHANYLRSCRSLLAD